MTVLKTQLTAEVVTMVQTVTVLPRCRALIVKSVDMYFVKNVRGTCMNLNVTSIVVIMNPVVVMNVKRNSVKNVGGAYRSLIVTSTGVMNAERKCAKNVGTGLGVGEIAIHAM
mmetsp:Transcript_19360/g.31724  ORF Transcript_19360/g.31724 Transcript_19360/m.31724 type:complete len:113 (+) Transcript_19360:1271-1609(+)